jgi:hypothetical protein
MKQKSNDSRKKLSQNFRGKKLNKSDKEIWFEYEKYYWPEYDFTNYLWDKIPVKSKYYRNLADSKGDAKIKNEKQKVLTDYIGELVTYFVNYKRYEENKILYETKKKFFASKDEKNKKSIAKIGGKKLQSLNIKLGKFEILEKKLLSNKNLQ